MAAETKIIIKGIVPYDGEYEFDSEEALTAREWRWLKQIGGYTPASLGEALENTEPDVVIGLAVITMRRAGKIGRDDVLTVADKLADYPFDGAHITLVGGEEDEQDPPALTSELEPSSPTGSLGLKESSGEDSTNGSATLVDVPSPTGISR